jgi:hypothetical protein
MVLTQRTQGMARLDRHNIVAGVKASQKGCIPSTARPYVKQSAWSHHQPGLQQCELVTMNGTGRDLLITGCQFVGMVLVVSERHDVFQSGKEEK